MSRLTRQPMPMTPTLMRSFAPGLPGAASTWRGMIAGNAVASAARERNRRREISECLLISHHSFARSWMFGGHIEKVLLQIVRVQFALGAPGGNVQFGD